MSHTKGNTDLPLINKTISRALLEICKERTDKIAVNFSQENVCFTFDQLLGEVDKLAAGLLACGLEPNDHVMLWGANYSTFFVSIFACSRSGLIFSCMNPSSSHKAVLKSLAMGDFRAVVCFPTSKPGELYRTLVEICPELRSCGKGRLVSKSLVKLTHVIMADEDHKCAGTFTLSEVFGKGTREALEKLDKVMIDDPHQLASIQFSMGTTGEPKPVMLNHFQILNSCLVTGIRLRLHENQVLCCPMPLFRGPVLCLAAMVTVVFGCPVIYPSALPLPPAIFLSIQENRCSCLITNPIAFYLMLRLPIVSEFDLTSLTSVCIVGEHIPQDLLNNMRRLTEIKQITVGVFLTEAGCMPIISQTDSPLETLVRAQGHVADHFEVKLLGFDGALAPRGTIGEICVRPIANSTFLGYYKENELSRNFFVHGWVLTGDVGIMDETGGIRVLGQKNDVIFPKLGDLNVSPVLPWTAERVLASQPGLLGVQLVGVPATAGTTKICAVVVLKDKDEHSGDAMEMRQQFVQVCKEEKLPEPDFLVFVKDFPRTHIKKVQKFKLRELVPRLIRNQL